MSDYGFAVISVVEYYGPETRRTLVAVCDTEAESQEIADAYDPDYSEQMGCSELSHNQSSATTAAIGAIIYAGDQCPSDNWDLIPDDLWPALDAVSAGNDFNRVQSVLEDNGYLIVAGETPDHCNCYLVMMA